MMGTFFDAVLGRVFSRGVELELGAGVDYTGGLYAQRNAANRRVEVLADIPAIQRGGYLARGDAAVIPSGPIDGGTAIQIDGALFAIDIDRIVSDGYAAEVTLDVWATIEGAASALDHATFCVARESSALHIIRSDGMGEDSASSVAVSLPGDCSGAAYTAELSIAGGLSVRVLDAASASDRTFRVTVRVGEPIAIGVTP